MTKWDVTLEALQPISISKKRSADTQWDTIHYIAGSTWRGAFAEKWKVEVGFTHPATAKLIEHSIFHDAYAKDTHFTPIYFKKMKTKEVYVNTLQTVLQENRFPTKIANELLVDSEAYKTKVLENSAIGIELSRTRESATAGRLYTIDAIAVGTVFETTATIDEEIVQLLAPNGELELYIGKKRFSGYGKTKVTFRKCNEENKIKERFTEQQTMHANPQEEVIVVLTARSSLILYDHFLRPTQNVSWTQHIQPLLPESLQLIEPKHEQTWGLGAIRNGWHQLWNAPKTVEHVLKPGAVYVATFEKTQQAQLLQALEMIIANGIGDKVQEGFGQVELAAVEQSAASWNMDVEAVERQALFSEKEEGDLLARATKFATLPTKVVNKRLNRKFMIAEQITLSQWQALLSLADPIYNITSNEQAAYITRRLNSELKNKWQNKAFGKTVGALLREDVVQIKQHYAKRATAAVRLYLKFIARYARMVEKEAKKYGK